MTTLQLENLTRHYPRRPVPAVRDLSLTVEAGELVALLGPSGSGKSTVLQLIAGIEQPDGGDVLFDGHSVLETATNRRGALLLFQKAYLFPFINVADNIAFGLKVRGMSKAAIAKEVTRMLELVALPGSEKRFPAQLSGGEQQRVALARALVVRPKLLMLDEPLSSLDPAVRQTLQEAICRIQRELGTTTLLVTHDLGEAMAMADRIALLLEGQLVAFDKPASLYRRPPNRAAAKFVGISTFFEGKLNGNCLSTPLGSLVVPEAASGTGQAIYAIRPEHIALQDHPCQNSFPATIKEITYRGDYSENTAVSGEHTFRTREYLSQTPRSVDDEVFVHFPCEHLFALDPA